MIPLAAILALPKTVAIMPSSWFWSYHAEANTIVVAGCIETVHAYIEEVELSSPWE